MIVKRNKMKREKLSICQVYEQLLFPFPKTYFKLLFLYLSPLPPLPTEANQNGARKKKESEKRETMMERTNNWWSQTRYEYVAPGSTHYSFLISLFLSSPPPLFYLVNIKVNTFQFLRLFQTPLSLNWFNIGRHFFPFSPRYICVLKPFILFPLFFYSIHFPPLSLLQIQYVTIFITTSIVPSTFFITLLIFHQTFSFSFHPWKVNSQSLSLI